MVTHPDIERAEELDAPPQKVSRNWLLALGLVLVAIILFLAIAGPSLAPRDPLEEKNIFQLEGEWKIPPLNPLTPGYPLGTDSFGRDLYSRLLWAVRPTMVMVSIVAAIRLLAGVVIGLLAGWFNGRPGRVLDSVIEIALSIPVLLVALGAIAVVGVELGIWAFIIGLSLTGWVETAQQVREQTRIVKGQVYVEAAHALGASNRQILVHHVLKQITPMLVMLFAFEVSSTLMATAGLGFLGYYIGGDVWVMVEDFVARRISGMPELGQMLATSWITLTRPWTMVSVGTLIFTTVLGFNLIGEGLRQGLNLTVRRRGFAARLNEQAGMWIDEHIWHPAAQVANKPAVRTGLALATLVIVFGASGSHLLRVVERGFSADHEDPKTVESNNPAQVTPTARSQGAGEGQAAEASPTPAGPRLNPTIAWEIEDENGFAGGPVLAADGEAFYALSQGGTLYALNLEGDILWQVELLAAGVGAPLLNLEGDIYVADREAGLNKVSLQGEVLWRFQSQAGDQSHSGPVLGPDGAVYYTVGTSSVGSVQAVSAEGEHLWATRAATPSFFQAPILSATGEFIYLKEDLFSAATGEKIELESEFRVNRFFTGEDGKDYLLTGGNVIEWQRAGNTIEYIHIVPADSDHSPTPNEVGVTADGHVWLLITSPGGGTSLEWKNLDGQVLGIARHRFSSGRLIARLPDLEVILCGNESFNEKNAECASLPLDSEKPAWSLRLPNIGPGLGGFYLDERLYLTTGLGSILAISPEPILAESESGDPQGTASSEDGLLWRYSFDQPLLGGVLPQIDAAGRAFAISESYRLYALDPDGSLRYQVDLPTGLFLIDQEEPIFGLVWPFALPDGTVLILSDQDTLYAVEPEGEISWEHELEAPVAERPLLSEDGILYLVDTQGRLSAFDLNGQRWRFQSQAANRPASPAVAGPDGTVYFTVTDLSRGYVQAVSADGQDLWVTQAKTGSFYEGLQFSQDGSLVFLKTDIFDAKTGELLEYEPSARVDEFILGRDGGTYYRSEHSLVQWQFGPGGYEELQVTYWERPTSRNFFPHIQVDASQLYWVNYFETLMWIRPDGTVINTFQPGLATAFDLENSRITLCDIPPDTAVMTCKAYGPESPEPVWQGQVGGVPDFEFWTVRHLDGYLYLLGEENTLYKYWIGEPGNP